MKIVALFCQIEVQLTPAKTTSVSVLLNESNLAVLIANAAIGYLAAQKRYAHRQVLKPEDRTVRATPAG